MDKFNHEVGHKVEWELHWDQRFFEIVSLLTSKDRKKKIELLDPQGK